MGTKRAFEVKQKAFFIIFKGLSVTKNRLKLEAAHLNIDSLILGSGIWKIWIFEKSANLPKTDA